MHAGNFVVSQCQFMDTDSRGFHFVITEKSVERIDISNQGKIKQMAKHGRTMTAGDNVNKNIVV